MNYKKAYQRLIAKRQEMPLSKDEQCEKHHIVPYAEGGSDDKSNLVRLTLREHYVAHLLLARIYNDLKMWDAIFRMQTCNKYKVTSRLFAMARREAMSRLSRMMIGNKNGCGKHNISDEGRARISAANKGKKKSQEFCNKMSITHKGKKPWNKGKKMSEAQKEKLRKANIGKKQSETTKRKRNAKLKGHPSYTIGMKWWNNGNNELFSRECPNGYKSGRLYKRKS